MGKIKIYTNNITIPETVTPVNLKIYDKDNNVLNVLKGKGSNFTTVEIAGISGKLKYNATKKHIPLLVNKIDTNKIRDSNF